MELKPYTCPQCGAPLSGKRDEENNLHCDHCGRDYYLKDDKPVQNNTTINNYYGYASAPANAPAVQDTSTQAKKINKGVIIAIVAVLLVIIIAGTVLLSLLKNTNTAQPFYSAPGNNVQAYTAEKRTSPKSVLMQNFVSYAFKKNYQSVTPQELDTLRYLTIRVEEINTFDNVISIYFSFQDGDPIGPDYGKSIQKINFPTSFSTEMDIEEILDPIDLHCFTGLVYLDVGNGPLAGNDGAKFSLDAFSNLQFYYSSLNRYQLEKISSSAKTSLRGISFMAIESEDIEKLLEFAPNIEFLILRDVVENSSEAHLVPLAKFSKLSHLTFSAEEELDNLGALAPITQITHLTLISNEYIKDYSFLFGMTNLEKLDIDYAENLKSIEFVKSMPKLQSLSLHYTDILDLSALDGKINLTELHLDEAGSFTDLQPLKTLTSLTALTLYLERDVVYSGVPHAADFASLKSLATNEVALAQLGQSSSVTQLSLVHGFEDTKAQYFEWYPNVTDLVLQGFSTWDNFSTSMLASMPHLQSLTLDKCDFDSESNPVLNELLALPQLEELYLAEGEYSARQDVPVVNPNLKKFYMSYATEVEFYEGSSGNSTSETDYLVADLVENLSGLNFLSLDGRNLKNLDFTKNMDSLAELHINDNYISDIVPLNQLDALEVVVCYNTPVSNPAALNEKAILLHE